MREWWIAGLVVAGIGWSGTAWAQCSGREARPYAAVTVSGALTTQERPRVGFAGGVQGIACDIRPDFSQRPLSIGYALVARVMTPAGRRVRYDLLVDVGPHVRSLRTRGDPFVMPYARGGLSHEAGRGVGLLGGGGAHGGLYYGVGLGAAATLEYTHWFAGSADDLHELRLDGGLEVGRTAERIFQDIFLQEHAFGVVPDQADAPAVE